MGHQGTRPFAHILVQHSAQVQELCAGAEEPSALGGQTRSITARDSPHAAEAPRSLPPGYNPQSM